MDNIYIRPLPVHDVLFIFGLLLVLDILCPILCSITKTTSVTYISKLAPSDGLRWSPPFNFEPNTMHHVKRRPNIGSLVLYGFLIVASSLTLAYSVLECETLDLLMYVWWAVLQLLLSVSLWVRELKEYTVVYKHKEHLLIIEVCQCANDAFKSVLLLEGYHGETYTYVVPNIDNWVVGNYHSAECTGYYIDELDSTPVNPFEVIWVGVGDKSSYSSWNNFLLPLLFVMLGVAVSSLPLISTKFTGSTFLVCALFMILSRRKTRKLKPINVNRTECFSDIEQLGSYTFTLINRSGKPFYYQSDDKQALRVTGTYICETVGNTVDLIQGRVDNEIKAVYRKPEKIGASWIAFALLAAVIVTFEFLRWWFLCIPASVLLSLIAVGLIRYKLKGDI